MKAWRRWRTYLLAAALGGIPMLIVIAVKLSPPTSADSGDAPPFLFQILRNGLFAPVTGLAVIQPFFLPLAAGLLAGDAVAGEAQAGTLRYLLVRPVARTRLVLGKYGAAMALLGLLLLWVVGCGAFWGGVVFGFKPLPTLSGTTLSVAQASLRILAAAGYILLGVSGIAAIGVCISTLTDSGPAAISFESSGKPIRWARRSALNLETMPAYSACRPCRSYSRRGWSSSGSSIPGTASAMR